MSTKMLLIHPSRLMRKLITSYAHSELSDVIVQSASGPEEGLGLLETNKYDLILSGLEMEGFDGLALREKVRAGGPNQGTPFIIMTSTDTPAQKERLIRHGVKHYVIASRAKEDLARLLATVFNPREKRAHHRYGIPGLVAIFHLSNGEVTAKVLNISLSGILCEQSCADVARECYDPALMDVLFPEEYGDNRAEGILTSVLRLNVMNWDAEARPSVVRVARMFMETPREAQAVVTRALERAEQVLQPPEEEFPPEETPTD
ncbi:MAG: response regulator [Thermodesulfobacteriota bacterium]